MFAENYRSGRKWKFFVFMQFQILINCMPIGTTAAYTVKKGSRFSRPQTGCHLTSSHWLGISIVPGQGEFVKWHPALKTFLYSVQTLHNSRAEPPWLRLWGSTALFWASTAPGWASMDLSSLWISSVFNFDARIRIRLPQMMLIRLRIGIYTAKYCIYVLYKKS